ncbi:hypothetical protein C9374_005448 [Naegleria lovaniensis]|uniref:Dolichyl-diphosphooligosaccharide--protein glycosyltransferase subunit KCP2 n=1 Tax=Naegleria lovaniensis TaxID=51637 RepID=A0AA88GJQ4_NAELO|nr:uncharacterized protein C9374_005448 [Naegleria lovaniensis]KAG2382246.1 hypothetical protein C9374_005448 [Naegleria lovaniensis]
MTTASSSLVAAATLAGITFFGLIFFKETLLSSDKGKVFVGFLCSLIYMFILTAYGNLKSNIKWYDMALCLIPAEIFASTLHGVCVTTCFLFSMAISYEMYKVAQHVYGGEAESSVPVSSPFDKKRK